MEPSSPAREKVPPDGLQQVDPARQQKAQKAHFAPELTNNSVTPNSPPETALAATPSHASKQSLNRNSTGNTQQVASPHASLPPAGSVELSNTQPHSSVPKSTSSRVDVNKGPSKDQPSSSSSSLVKKDNNHSGNSAEKDLTVPNNRPPSSYRSSPTFNTNRSSPTFNTGTGIKRDTTTPIPERPDSVLSRGSSSQQAKYHDSCIPQIDPALVIGNPRRTPSPRHRNKRPSSFKRPGSNTTLLSRRESVTNLIFSGPSVIGSNADGTSGWDTVYKKRLSRTFSYASSLFSRMGSPSRGEPDVTPGEFDVMEDDDYSTTRMSKLSFCSSSRQRLSPSSRPGFLYQVVTFDDLSKDVPPFVRNYAQKYGKMITESFILRLNYLRRRRQLGEMTSTINIGNSSSKRPTTTTGVGGSPR